MTTKQDALELILAKCRQWEERGAEVPARNPRWVVNQMRIVSTALAGVVSPDGSCPEQRDALVVLGAAALYLLRDEVDVLVPGQLTEDLDTALARWTGEGGHDRP
jgi:hypothetical protein